MVVPLYRCYSTCMVVPLYRCCSKCMVVPLYRYYSKSMLVPFFRCYSKSMVVPLYRCCSKCMVVPLYRCYHTSGIIHANLFFSTNCSIVTIVKFILAINIHYLFIFYFQHRLIGILHCCCTMDIRL